jgi:hypothetical protein
VAGNNNHAQATAAIAAAITGRVGIKRSSLGRRRALAQRLCRGDRVENSLKFTVAAPAQSSLSPDDDMPFVRDR